LGAKALADKLGVTRQHIAYHIGELQKFKLIKDMRAGTIVIYHVTDLGRTVLQRIHSTSAPQAKERTQDSATASIPPPAARASSHERITLGILEYSLPLAGLGLLTYSIIMAFIDRKPSYVIGGLIIFAIFMAVRSIAIKGSHLYGRR
jgi:hypothetical protein